MLRKKISMREANQHLSRVVREVEQGKEFVITRRGAPVAKLVPAGQPFVLTEEQERALERTLARMDRGYRMKGRMPTRDEIYEL